MNIDNTRVREVAASYAGRIIAAAEFKKTVHIWDLKLERQICCFESIFESGGKRLAISEDGKLCVAGAYDKHGIAMYDALNGDTIWQRKDLNKVQGLYFSSCYQDCILACFDNKPCHVLEAKTGETMTTIKGLRKFAESPFAKIQLLDKKRAIEVLDFEQGQCIGKIKPLTFAVLSSIFTENSVIISEAAGPVSSYAIQGAKLMWRYTPKLGSHVLAVSYCEEMDEIFAAQWSYEKGGDSTLLAFDKNDGNVHRKQLLRGIRGQAIFALKGSRLISYSGKVLDTITGKILGDIG